MAQSPEFPQYLWMPPKSYTGGRKSGQPSVIVIHTTEGSEGPNSAEDGAAYDQRRTDGTSAHFYIDSNTAVQCVRTTDEAHTAAAMGNDIGIHLELCGKAGQSASQWADPISAATVANAAEVCRTLLGKYPNIPIVRLTPAQLQNGQRGFCGHVDISNAWHQTTHTDPGPNFPWSRLFNLIKEDEMDQATFDALMDGWVKRTYSAKDDDPNAPITVRNYMRAWPWVYQDSGQPSAHNIVLGSTGTLRGTIPNELTALKTAVAGINDRLDTITAAAGGSPEIAAIVAALRPIIRDAVADGLEGGSQEVRADNDGDNQ